MASNFYYVEVCELMELLRYTPPYENECLTSYLYRLAVKNSCSVDWILNEIGLKHVSSTHKIDHLNRTDSILKLSEMLNCSIETLFNMTVHKYSNNLWDPNKYNTKGKYRAVELFLRHNPAYCPLCLREEKYNRLYWYLYPIRICIFHETYLIDRCPWCGKLINSFNIASSVCFCGKPLEKFEPRKTYSKMLIDSQRRNYAAFDIILNADDINISIIKSKIEYINLFMFIANLFDSAEKGYIRTYMHEYRVELKFGTEQKNEFIEGIISNWPYRFTEAFIRFFCDYGKYYLKDDIWILDSMITSLNHIYKQTIRYVRLIS